MKDGRLYLSFHSDLWDERMADLLSNCGKVHSLGLFRNNKLLAKLSNFPLLSLMASLSTLNFALNLSLLNGLLLDFLFLAFAHRGCNTNCLYHSSLDWHIEGRAHNEVTP